MLKSKDNIQKYKEDIPKTNRNNHSIEIIEEKVCAKHEFICGFTGSGATKEMIHLENEIEKSH